MDISIGQHLSNTHIVTDDDTATALGSGDMPVLATPRLLAWLEAVTMQMCGIGEDRTSVGVRVELDHHRPSPVGTEVTCTAELLTIEDRDVVFRVSATQMQDGHQVIAAQGLVARAMVDRQRFLNRLQS